MAKTRWWLAGYTIDDTMKGSVLLESDAPQHQDEWIYVDFVNEDESVHLQYFTNSIGQMLGLMNVKNAWQNNEYNYEEYRRHVKDITSATKLQHGHALM